MSTDGADAVETIATIKDAAGLIIGASEGRVWIEVFFDGDLMHTKTVNLPPGAGFDVYVEEVPHKATVYEHPRTMVFFSTPCDLDIAREGHRVIVTGIPRNNEENRA
jgi:hypothetical protein